MGKGAFGQKKPPAEVLASGGQVKIPLSNNPAWMGFVADKDEVWVGSECCSVKLTEAEERHLFAVLSARLRRGARKGKGAKP